MLIPSDVTVPRWVGRPLDTDIAHLADDISGIADLEQLHVATQNDKMLYWNVQEQPEFQCVLERREKGKTSVGQKTFRRFYCFSTKPTCAKQGAEV